MEKYAYIRVSTKEQNIDPKVHTLHQIAVTFNMTLSEFLDFPELNDYPIDDEE